MPLSSDPGGKNRGGHLSTPFPKFGNVFLTRLTRPAPAGESADCGTPSPVRSRGGRRAHSSSSILPSGYNPLPSRPSPGAAGGEVHEERERVRGLNSTTER
jgi:hypothetical protein